MHTPIIKSNYSKYKYVATYIQLVAGYQLGQYYRKHIIIATQSDISRHTVVCQQPRKQKKTCGTQVCHLLVPQICQIKPSVFPKLLSRFLPNLYIFCLTYTY